METEDAGAAIVKGNERVLRARLEDGRFYFEQDRKVPLEERLSALEKMIFHATLGSVAEKVKRLEALAPAFCQHVPNAEAGLAIRAAQLCKSDLASGMVGEFPELQGVMGRYYSVGAR